jgi:hypothetical protein
MFLKRIKKSAGVFLLFGLFFPSDLLYPEENYSPGFGLGMEGNFTASQDISLGQSFSLEVRLFRYIVNGVILTASNNFSTTAVLEPELFARWYFLTLGFPSGGFFVQGGVGISILMEKNHSDPRLLAGLTGGFRFPFKGGDYFLEPYVKGGYPFLFGFGLRTGCRL